MLIYLLRHGRTEYNAQKRYQGQRNIPLSAEGLARLRQADFCPEVVYVTPLQRTSQTARVLFPGAKLVPVEGLKEMNFGRFEGQKFVRVEQDPEYLEWVRQNEASAHPDGERKSDFCDRVCAAFAALVDKALADGEERLVIVAHGGTQMAAMEAMGRPAEDYYSWCAPNGCGYRLTVDPEKWAAGEHILTLAEKICCTKQAHTW